MAEGGLKLKQSFVQNWNARILRPFFTTKYDRTIQNENSYRHEIAMHLWMNTTTKKIYEKTVKTQHSFNANAKDTWILFCSLGRERELNYCIQKSEFVFQSSIKIAFIRQKTFYKKKIVLAEAINRKYNSSIDSLSQSAYVRVRFYVWQKSASKYLKINYRSKEHLPIIFILKLIIR